MQNLFSPFTEAASIANLQRRVRMQEDALRQAREDLAAREREIEPDVEDEPASGRDPRSSLLHCAKHSMSRGTNASLINPTFSLRFDWLDGPRSAPKSVLA
jgi:hypothetical protein